MSLVDRIRAAGLWDEGYCIQQDPEEFAALVECLEANGPHNHYLAIGIAAGGVERFICENVGVKNLRTIDDGSHKDANRQEVNLTDLHCLGRKTTVSRILADSHSKEAAYFLNANGDKYDLVGIDGDHSPQGVAQDWELVQPYLAPGALVWFHDINISEAGQTGARKLWSRLKTEYAVLLETKGQFGIGVIRV